MTVVATTSPPSGAHVLHRCMAYDRSGGTRAQSDAADASAERTASSLAPSRLEYETLLSFFSNAVAKVLICCCAATRAAIHRLATSVRACVRSRVHECLILFIHGDRKFDQTAQDDEVAAAAAAVTMPLNFSLCSIVCNFFFYYARCSRCGPPLHSTLFHHLIAFLRLFLLSSSFFSLLIESPLNKSTDDSHKHLAD